MRYATLGINRSATIRCECKHNSEVTVALFRFSPSAHPFPVDGGEGVRYASIRYHVTAFKFCAMILRRYGVAKNKSESAKITHVICVIEYFA